jgi:hypothetical protein
VEYEVLCLVLPDDVLEEDELLEEEEFLDPDVLLADVPLFDDLAPVAREVPFALDRPVPELFISLIQYILP